MSNTIFVIGAGASSEVGLPVGYELKEIISDLLDIKFQISQISGDRVIHKAISEKHDGERESIGNCVKAGWKIRDNIFRATSIDSFIDNHKQDKDIELCGKLAIVRAILNAEKRSRLFLEPGIQDFDYPALDDAYFNSLFDVIKKNCDVSQLKAKFGGITIVIYNYDRCVEHYLYHSLKSYYSIPHEQVLDILSSLTIIHPYGKIGCLPWENKKECIGFGQLPDASETLKLSENIKTFSEGFEDGENILSTLELKLLEANKIVFLGFHFHKLNLDHFKVRAVPNVPKKRVYGTAFGRSDVDRKAVENHLNNIMPNLILPNEVHLSSDLTCVKLFREYEFALSV